MFLLYINDLPDGIQSHIKLFADDTKIYGEANEQVGCNRLQEDISKLVNWSDKWQLKFHPDKCQVMRIGKGHREFQYTMSTPGGVTTLQVTDKEKDLGIILDNKLTYQDHISTKVQKANQFVGLIRRSFHFLDERMFCSLYKSLVRPILEYGHTIWHLRWKKDMQAVERVQARATAMVPSLAKLSYEDRLRKLKLPTMKYRRRRGQMIETYKILHGAYNSDFPWLTVDDRNTTRGTKYKLYKPRKCTKEKLNSFSCRVVNDWLALPEEIVDAPTLNTFKNRLDRFWLAFQYVHDL